MLVRKAAVQNWMWNSQAYLGRGLNPCLCWFYLSWKTSDSETKQDSVVPELAAESLRLMRNKSGEAVVFGVSGVVLIYEYHRTRETGPSAVPVGR